MELDKAVLVNIVIVIHMALTGLALMQLFRLKNTTGGVLIITFLALMIPIIGPSSLIFYFKSLNKKKERIKVNHSFQSKQKHKKQKTT